MVTTTSNPVTLLNIAQTFFLDPGSVKNAPTVSITKVGIFFKSKPSAENNRSGLYKPGVDLYLCETRVINNLEVPDTAKMIYGAHARATFDQIVTSTGATVETMFEFDFPILVDTGKSYAIILKYDGDEEYDVWKSVEGNILVGTNNTSAGPAGQYIGKFFEYSYIAGLNNSASNTSINISQAGNVSGNWNPLSSTDLKFNVYAARFVPDSYANTVSIDPATGSQVVNVVARRSFMLYKKPYEFIMYDRFVSNTSTSLIGGELVYQNNVMRSETISVVNGNNRITSQSANFAALFANNSNADRYLVVYSGANKAVRKVTSISSNNAIVVDNALPFTNNAARFARVVTGKVDLTTRTTVFGTSEQALVLYDSSANSSLRFVNNTIEDITVSVGGTGYANSDYILVHEWGGNEAAEVNAIANVVTDANGTIISTSLTNKGIGFLGDPIYEIRNANGVSSTGTSADLEFDVGATIIAEQSGVQLNGCEVINVPVNSMLAVAPDIENPYGTSYYFKQHYLYYATSDGISDVVVVNQGTAYSNADTVSVSGGTGAFGTIVTDSAGKIVDIRMKNAGSGYTDAGVVSIDTSTGSNAVLVPIIGVIRSNVNAELDSKLVSLFERHRLSFTSTPLILSRSYEVTQPNTSISTVTGTGVNTNISSVIEMVITSNNVYSTADILSGEVDVFYEKFAINNDYENEHTGNGKAVSKHISQVSSFGDNRLAEDIRVFVDAYRPSGTDFKVYARIHNNKDPEPFVDKDWTLLEMKTGNGVFSSAVNEHDNHEYEFGFYSYPNSEFTGTGTVTTTFGSAAIAGSNTLFDTEFSVNELVKVYSPLFPENYVISVVNSIPSATSLTLKSAIANNNVVGSGFLVDKVEFPHQTFNDALNDNVSKYYNEALAAFNGYNTFAIKIVFLSEDQLAVPKIENIRVAGVTA